VKGRSSLSLFLALGLLSLAASCNQSIGGLFGSLFGGDNQNSNSNSNTNSNDNSGDDPGNTNDNTNNDNDSEAPRPRPPAGTSARVRNESAFRADVTLQFIEDSAVSHLAFVRVLPESTTMVTGPTMVDVLELSGASERGVALPEATFFYGVDFSETTPAEYLIPADLDAGPDPDPPTLTMLEPSSDITVALGGWLLTTWEDEAPTAGTTVRVGLRTADDPNADVVFLGPAVGAVLDGINDQVSVVVEGVTPGFYEVVGQIDDGTNRVESMSPGRVQVVNADDNIAPLLMILEPDGTVELINGDSLLLVWQDEDPDDNATIVFSLEVNNPNTVGVGPYTIGPSLAEDPDGPSGDSITVTIDDVLPGLYDLVGRIDDGELVGTHRVLRAVRVLADPQNDTPQLTLVEPATDVTVAPGGSFTVRWTDSDENDNASISLFFDPDLTSGTLDGDEVLLVSALQEDNDGAGDRITLRVPTGVPKGSYRIAGLITDGVVEVATWAPGRLHLGVSGGGDGPPELAFERPIAAVFTRLGESIEIQIRADNLPIGSSPRLKLSNEASGGSIRVDVTPDPLVLNGAMSLPLPAGAASIPNRAWPRSFELSVEVVVDGVSYSAKAPGVVWIRQEVELVHAAVINCDCSPGAEPVDDPRAFIGFGVTYYGGGFTDRDVRGDVQLWVTADGVVPTEPQLADSRHGFLGTVSESPNLERTVQLPLRRLAILDSQGQLVDLAILPGVYQIAAVVDHPPFGRVVSPPAPELLTICRCLPSR